MKNKRIISGCLVIAGALLFGAMFASKLAENQKALSDNILYQPSVAGVTLKAPKRDSGKRIEQDIRNWNLKDADKDLEKLRKQAEALK